MSPRRKGLSNEEILKFLNELSENDSCDKNTFDDEENFFFINEGKTIVENVHIISSSESSSSYYKLNKNIPSKWSSGITKITNNCKSVKKKKIKKSNHSFKVIWKKRKMELYGKYNQKCSVSSG
jgi:hypothetical protein